MAKNFIRYFFIGKIYDHDYRFIHKHLSNYSILQDPQGKPDSAGIAVNFCFLALVRAMHWHGTQYLLTESEPNQRGQLLDGTGWWPI